MCTRYDPSQACLWFSLLGSTTGLSPGSFFLLSSWVGVRKNFREPPLTRIKLFCEKTYWNRSFWGVLEYDQNSKFSSKMVKISGKEYAEIPHFRAFCSLNFAKISATMVKVKVQPWWCNGVKKKPAKILNSWELMSFKMINFYDHGKKGIL